jgi:exopolysaccharide biosynthesis polyprenyl glycosylphosphotransferase
MLPAVSGIVVGRRTAQVAALDAGLIVGALVLSLLAVRYSSDHQVLTELFRDWTGATLIALTVHLGAFYVFELYNLRLDFRRGTNILRCAGAVATASLLVAVSSFVAPHWSFGRLLFAVHAVLLAALTAGVRILFSRAMRSAQPPDKALLVTPITVPEALLDEMARSPDARFHLVGTIAVNRAPLHGPKSSLRGSTPPPVGSVADCAGVLRERRLHHLVVAGIDALLPDDAHELLRLKGEGVEVHDLVDVFQTLTGRLPLEMLGDRYFLRVPAFTRDTRPWLSNLLRVLDVAAALVLLVLSSPLWVFAAVGIKLTMPGPVFYAQERVGKGEVPYVLTKFRSMRTDAERDGPQWSKGSGDPRVTPFGRFLRRSRIDELPQLWSVLRGEMSLVGPRPERPVFVAELKREIPYYALRFQVKPGLTGWAQVNYRYGASVDETRIKLSYDLFWVQERSVALWLVTLLKTIQTVLFKPGS